MKQEKKAGRESKCVREIVVGKSEFDEGKADGG